jgi:hypothetical protein
MARSEALRVPSFFYGITLLFYARHTKKAVPGGTAFYKILGINPKTNPGPGLHPGRKGNLP